MSIVLNTELCWPLAAVGPNNAVVELSEHAGRGVGDNVSNPAKLPAILFPAHVHTAANQGVIELGRLFVRASRSARSRRRPSREGQCLEQCPRRT